jgi:phosphate transport system substrate-binding protein
MSRRWVLLLGLLLLGGCANPEPPRRNMVVSGPRSFQPLLDDLAERFQEDHPDVRISFESTFPNRAVADAREGLADLAVVGRELRTDETGVLARPVARDAIALIVHRNNHVPSLTHNQVVGLFTRLFRNWNELGCSDSPIVLVGLNKGRSTGEVVLDYLGLKANQVRPEPVVGTSEQAVVAVAARPGAVAFVSLAEAGAALKAGSVRIVPLAGTLPTPDTVSTGKYLLVRPVVLVSRREQSELVREFLDFARSSENRDLFIKHGFVPGGGP